MTENEHTDAENDASIERMELHRGEGGEPTGVMVALTAPPEAGDTLHYVDPGVVSATLHADGNATNSTGEIDDGESPDVDLRLSKWELRTLTTTGRARWTADKGGQGTRFTVTTGTELLGRDAVDSPLGESTADENSDPIEDTEDPESTLSFANTLTNDMALEEFSNGEGTQHFDVQLLRRVLPEWFGGCPNCGTDDTRIGTWEEKDPNQQAFKAKCDNCSTKQSMYMTAHELNELRADLSP